MNCIDLFAGCGGLTEGFKQAGGFTTLGAVEWELAPALTLKRRLRDKWGYQDVEDLVVRFDIQRTEELLSGFKDPDYGEHIGLKSLVRDRKVDVIIGGPPCQAYSIAGRVRDANGMRDDYRNFLFESFLSVTQEFKPKYFIFENVEGILSSKPGGIFITERIREAFANAGYRITSDLRGKALLDASQFGVPQRRKRVIILGVREDLFDSTEDPEKIFDLFYHELLKEQKTSIMTVRQALKDLPVLVPNPAPTSKLDCYKEQNPSSKVENHHARFHSIRDQDIFRDLALDDLNGRTKYPNSQALIELYKQHTGKESKFHKYNVLSWNEPSNTIPAHLHKDGLRHIHPDPNQARSITVREAGRLQGFPDDFIFEGSKSDQYKMVGNAVPPPLAKRIANALIKLHAIRKDAALQESS